MFNIIHVQIHTVRISFFKYDFFQDYIHIIQNPKMLIGISRKSQGSTKKEYYMENPRLLVLLLVILNRKILLNGFIKRMITIFS